MNECVCIRSSSGYLEKPMLNSPGIDISVVFPDVNLFTVERKRIEKEGRKEDDIKR